MSELGRKSAKKRKKIHGNFGIYMKNLKSKKEDNAENNDTK